MLTGRTAFERQTAPETISAILTQEPLDVLPATVPSALARIVHRCLEKTRDARFQSARDLAFALEMLSATSDIVAPAAAMSPGIHWSRKLAAAVVVLSLITAVASWMRRPASVAVEDPFLDATFTRLTNGRDTVGAGISPYGRFVEPAPTRRSTAAVGS